MALATVTIFFWLKLVDARLSPARGTHAARSEMPVREAKRTQAEPTNLLPRQALTLSPTMPNAPEAAPDLRFALPGGTPLSRTSAEKIVHLDPADWIR